MTAEDLKNYKPVERTVVRGTYRGYDIVVDAAAVVRRHPADPDAQRAGGPQAARQRSGVAASDDRDDEARLRRPRAVHGRSRLRQGAGRGPDLEALRRDAARSSINRERATAGRTKSARQPAPFEGATPRTIRSSTATATRCPTPIRSTTATASGWSPKAPACCSTTSSTISPPSPDAPNAFGLIGLNEANAPGPNKRPLSSMTPTIVFKDGKPLLVTGSPGGSRIITVVLQVRGQRDRPPHEHRRRGARAAHPSPMAAGPGRWSSAACRRRWCRRWTRAATTSCCGRCSPRPIRSW